MLNLVNLFICVLFVHHATCFNIISCRSAFKTFSVRSRFLSNEVVLRSSTSASSASDVAYESGHFSNKNVKERFPSAFFPKLSRPPNVPSNSPPPSVVVQMPDFLNAEECRRIIEAGERIAATGAECEEYLNARVNSEVSTLGTSEEAKLLIEECKVDMAEDAGGGFRVRLEEALVKEILEERVAYVMGLEGRSFFFEEGAWER